VTTNKRHTPWYRQRLRQQECWKFRTPELPSEAKVPGFTMIEEKGIRRAVGPFPVCLPLTHADHNLVRAVRREGIARFSHYGIEWHQQTDAPDGSAWPSTHLLSSQVQCVNVLLSLEAEPASLLAWVREFVPDAVALEPVEDGHLVAFEWTGPGNADFLKERSRSARRGKYQTSPDAVLLVRRSEGVTVVLIEWKDTEFYPGRVEILPWRRRTYSPLWSAADGLFTAVVPFEAYFQEPHYQLMRLHLLASRFLRELPGVTEAKVLHVIPTGNLPLRELVPTALSALGRTIDEVWSQLGKPSCGVSYSLADSDSLLLATPHLAHRYADGPDP
jgi:hypothetical protein